MDVGGWLGWIVRINPLTYGVAGLRHYLQNGMVDADAGAAVAGRLLARVAGVCRPDAGRRLADRRHALAPEICYERSNHRHIRRRRISRTRRARRSAPAAAVFPGAARAVRRWPTAAGRGGRSSNSSSIAARRSSSTRSARRITEFELTERSGKPFRSRRHEGQSLGRHLFLHDLPRQLHPAQSQHPVMHNLPELKDVTWVSITCDPDTDTSRSAPQVRRSLASRSRALAVLRGPIWNTRSESPRA